MNKYHVSIALVLALVLIPALVMDAHAQGAAAPAAGSRGGADFALIDIGVIFKNHTLFKQHMADLQADMERAEQQMKKETDSLRGLKEKLNEYRAGTEDYKRLEEEIAKRTADLNVRFQLQKKEFGKSEAKIYYGVYQAIQQEVDAYAQSVGILAVLKFSSEQADIEKPDEVLRDLNKPVIWYARNMDITPIILESLNRRALQQGRQPQGPVNLPPR